MENFTSFTGHSKLSIAHPSANSMGLYSAAVPEESKRGRRSYENQNHPFVSSRDRGGNDYQDGAMGNSCRISSSSSGSHRYSAGTSETPTASVMRRNTTSLYKHIVGQDPDEKAMEDINTFIHTEQDKKNIGNETRWMERLKIHLIKQGREKESKRVVELYQKLKGMSVVKNREAIIGLMYNLFDREQTRVILATRAAASRKVPPTATASESAGTMKNVQSSDEITGISTQGGIAVVKTERISAKISNVASFATSEHGRPTTAPHSELKSRNIYMPQDIDHTPVPRLHCSSDNLLNDDMTSDTKVPSLSKRRDEISVSNKIKNWDALNQRDFTQRNGGNAGFHSVSTISKFSDEQSRLLVSSQHTGIDITPHNIFSSTPMEASSSNRQKQFVNLRKLQEAQTGSLRSNVSKVSNSGTAQTFANARGMERDLIRDIVFILQGIDGQFIKTTAKGTFEITTKQFVHPSLRLQTLKLCELGYCYTKVRNYCEKSTTGLMAQGFKHAIEKELQEFYRLLAVIQGRIQQTVVDTPLSEDLPTSRMGDMTLLKLGIWLFECRPRLQVLAGMVESCDSKRGGDLCSVIHRYTQHGDPLVSNLTVSLLTTICKPLYIMLSQWILYGELEDPFNEFFIAGDPACKKEQLWHLKYRIRSEMLPTFISLKQAEKILAIGKNINFLKEICNNTDGFEGRYEIKALLETGEVECLFLEGNSSLQYAIEMSYKTTSEKVLKVLIDESRLLEHLKAIKKYLLLGQGDFIQYFLELIQEELSKPASKLYNHNISAILESAVRATNAQFESEDILSRLDTRILPTSDKDLGWDVFCLDYKVHGPIGTVLTEDIMNGYNKLFNSLWRTKRIEIILSTLWKNQTVLFKYLRLIPELAPVLHRSQLLISEMIHFVHQTQYYIMFEATECAWERLMEEVNKSSDLDEVIKAHQKFLDTIFKRSLLDLDSRELLNQLRGIFDSVHELRLFLLEFNDRVELEVNHRKHLEPNTEDVRDAQRQFFSTFVMQAKGKIETLYTTTQDLVRTFLLVLNRQQDLTLQCLSFRLDFNEYYHHKDSRLSQPLTFQHRRLSSSAFTPLNMSGSFTGGNGSPLMTSMSIPEISEC